MNQQHLYLIIVKINGRYRTIAAVCLIWGLYQESPRVCWRLLQILGHPVNKKLVAHELSYAVTFTESLWDDLAIDEDEDEETDITKRIPFPFTTTCLALAVGFNLGTANYENLTVLSAGINLTLAKEENDDGFTIVDVTNLDDIHFYFLGRFLRPSQKESAVTPLTAEEYTAWYDEARAGDVDLSCWGLINADTLRDLWPDVNWCDRNDDGPGGTYIEQEARIVSLRELIP